MKKAVGIVIEYNPFHNGHKYHLDKAKELGDIVIGVMSGDYVQRGEPAFINKWSRGEIALKEGIDILCELPSYYSTQSAEIFAKSSIGILKNLGVTTILFGSESSNIEKLKKILELEKNKEFNEEIRRNLDEGISYPNAYSLSIKKFLEKDIEINSNDILGIEYLRAIKYYDEKIEAKTLKRRAGGYYSQKEENNIMSATGIRKLIFENKSIENLVTKNSFEVLEKEKEKITKISDFYPLIRYAILSKKEKLADYQDVENGLENRIYEMALKYENHQEFFNNLITKRYTIGRIQRILIHILLDITKADTNYLKENIPYIRILGFSKKGREYLKTIEKNNDVKILTSFKNIKKILNEKEIKFLELNEKASIIYKIINPYEDRKIPIIID
ncbi:MAG: nucleotidyltransferase [Fusobacterium perfoetens]|uniref:nucleotidyltransferase n=1 Tax=Fusobacterium perfoetens TaxID=852 RepID=UPI0023F1B797|nr:nucleotidyltransferase [Fusobacterium perfoetens]MCI6153293.1 nucleotidyltransferase [Fusobacterium perfoetens]MDY3237811.1 nucleotidyltransferase [Fusobacterium perfoetens]